MAPADASAVVVESTAPDYTTGALLGSGSEIVLGAGETVVIMHRSGAIRTLETPGAHVIDRPEDARISTARAAMAALMSDAPRPELGATRSFDYDSCMAAAEGEPGFPARFCDDLRVEFGSDATLSVTVLAIDTTLTPASPVILELTASFDAQVVCALEDLAGTPVISPLRIGPAPSHAVYLPAGVVTHAPARGGPKLSFPVEAGDYRVVCDGFDAGLWNELKAARALQGDHPRLEPDTWLSLVSNSADLLVAKRARATRSVTMVE